MDNAAKKWQYRFMTRLERLFALLQALRGYRRPVSAHALSEKLCVSIRTLYRDIAFLQSQGADIQGEPGIGYVLHPSFMLPPLMFSRVELEAMMLGFRWVSKFADKQMIDAASQTLAKINAVLPRNLRHELESTTLLVGPRLIHDDEIIDLETVRTAIRKELMVKITYVNQAENLSSRIIWPFALGYFSEMRILAAWCEKQNDYRHFRTDRISSLEVINKNYPKRRAALLKEWRKAQKDIRINLNGI